MLVFTFMSSVNNSHNHGHFRHIPPVSSTFLIDGEFGYKSMVEKNGGLRKYNPSIFHEASPDDQGPSLLQGLGHAGNDPETRHLELQWESHPNFGDQ